MRPAPEPGKLTPVTGLILAGGEARRMGGADKGLQPFLGRPLIERIIERLRPQVNELLLNPSAGSEGYERFGCRLVVDEFRPTAGGKAGPLAGIHAALRACSHPLLVTVPCDAPNLPMDLVARLRAALEAADAEAALAFTGGYRQPVFGLMKRDLHSSVADFLRAGGTRTAAWYASLRCVDVNFDDQPDSFANVNTIDELRAVERGSEFEQGEQLRKRAP